MAVVQWASMQRLYYWKKNYCYKLFCGCMWIGIEVGRHLRGCLVQLLAQLKAGLVRWGCSVLHPTEPWTPDGDPMASLSNLCWCLPILMVKFLLLSDELASENWLLHLSVTVPSPFPSSLNLSINQRSCFCTAALARMLASPHGGEHFLHLIALKKYIV